MANMNVSVVSAESQIFEGQASFVVLPGEKGELGILPGHAPFISKIKPGLVVITKADSGEKEELFVAGGLIEILSEQVTVLADTVMRCKDLDFERAAAAKQKAEELLVTATDAQEIALVEAELAMLTAQLTTLRRIKNRM